MRKTTSRKPKKYNHPYKLIYKMEKKPEGIVKEDIPEGFGATDAMLLCSIIYPPDGSLSIYFIGVDGRKEGEIQENLEDVEWFKVWTLLASRLAASKTLRPDQKNFCQETFESMRVKLLGFSLN
jgi:hypothetical protein